LPFLIYFEKKIGNDKRKENGKIKWFLSNGREMAAKEIKQTEQRI
jgi:hypothetical protein